MTKKNRADSPENATPQTAIRGRLMARIAGAAAIGVQFLPNMEQLHKGLQLAAVMLLAVDVVIDLLGGVFALVRQASRYIRNARTIWRKEADGSVVVGVKVRRTAVVPRVVARVTGRVTSSLLALLSDESGKWHLVLLVGAFVIVVLDALVEIARVVGEGARRRLG
ncbi:hypothetical protein ACIRU8_45455 [Streptomyces sp. NPDC101175]|uniref:hypothetical protein n=1 Tax=Streptomyces sp. NPDC101175 TaxID=3366123 RepID=UPI0038339376